MQVTVPPGAQDGDINILIVEAVSQGATAFDQSVLTTTARVIRGVEISPAMATGHGFPGQVVTYTLTVTNTGLDTDTIQISAGGQVWTTTIQPSTLNLASGASATATVRVTIPAGAAQGLSDHVTITAQATGVSDSSALTTVVDWRKVYLPIILK